MSATIKFALVLLSLMTSAQSFVVPTAFCSQSSVRFLSPDDLDECEEFVSDFVQAKEASIQVGDLGYSDESSTLPFNQENVEEILNEIRPFLKEHGGNVQLDHVDMETKNVFLHLEGQCAHCPLAEGTLQDGVRRGFASSLQEFGSVIRV